MKYANAMQELLKMQEVQKALIRLKDDADNAIENQLELCAIRSPSFQEKERANRYLQMFQELDFDEVWQDDVGNVFGRLKGTGEGPCTMVAAHLDTVFDETVDCTPRREGNIYYAPGIADDTRGLAEVLSIARIVTTQNLRTKGDLIFVGNIAEEGNGDLYGVRHIFDTMGDSIDGFITIDGTSTGNIVINGIASYKYKATFRGSGGHTLIHFGYPNANFAMGRALAKVSEIRTSPDYRSSFSAGIVNGGTVISSLPIESTILFDMRCINIEELNKIRDQIVGACYEACEEENKRWNHPSERVTCTVELFGGHPLGIQSDDAPILQIARAADEALNIPVEIITSAVTDANIPLSRGVPAVALGRGGMQKHGHTLNECWDSTDSHLSPQRALLMILAMSGYRSVDSML